MVVAAAILARYKREHDHTHEPTRSEVIAAGIAVTVTGDALLSHLTQEQRDYIARLVISVELTGVEAEDTTVLQNNRCFMNSRDLVAADKAGRVNYVEGVADGTYHAWNEIDGVRFDITAVINQHVHEDSDWSKSDYRGEVITREQLAERESRRNKAWEQWDGWLVMNKDAAKNLLDNFYQLHGDVAETVAEMGLNEQMVVRETVWAQMDGYPSQAEKDGNATYFSHAEALSLFGYENPEIWLTNWVTECLAEMPKETDTAMAAAVAA